MDTIFDAVGVAEKETFESDNVVAGVALILVFDFGIVVTVKKNKISL